MNNEPKIIEAIHLAILEQSKLELGDHSYAFDRGAFFLLPLIEKLIEQRDDYVDPFNFSSSEYATFILERDQDLLNILK